MIEFLEIVFAIAVFIVVLGAIVLVHEAGHFFFARKANILCHEFSIGMGPLIKQKKKGETFYSIRSIPLGGYVAMAGEDMNERAIKLETKVGINLTNNIVSEIILSPKVAADITGIVKSYELYSRSGEDLYIELQTETGITKYFVSKEAFYVFSPRQKVQLAPYDRCFESKSKTARALTLVAGSAMNFVLGFVIFLVVGLGSGVPSVESSAIGSISKGSGAAVYLQEKDEIVSVNNQNVSSWLEFQEVLADFYLEDDIEKVAITVKRNGVLESFMIDTTIGINCVGLSNVSASENEKGEGVILGVLPSGNKAYQAGLRKDDIIYKVEVVSDSSAVKRSMDVNNWKEVMDSLDNLALDDRVKFYYYTLEDGTYVAKETKLIEPYNDPTLANLGIPKYSIILGVSPEYHFDLFLGIKNGFVLFGDTFKDVFITLGMVTGIIKHSQVSVSDLAGPVGIFQMVQSYLSTDFLTFISFVGLLTINIGIINLLPIPALDGGRLMFLGYEAVTRKPVNKKFEVIVNNIVFLLLMGLLLFVTYRDILRF